MENGCILIGLVLLGAGCAAPGSRETVAQAREERVMNHRVVVVWSKDYQVDLGGLERLHAFDIRKYAKIHRELVTDGRVNPEDVAVPPPVTDEEVRLVHTPGFLKSLDDPESVATYLEAPMVAALGHEKLKENVIAPFRCATGGTILAGRLALEHGIGVNLGGGYHHARPARGEGFCVFNDVAIAIRVLRREKRIRRALVVDLDVHQGNGTAVVFDGDDEVYTFSMHESDIYPVPKELSDLDVELPPGTGDEVYLAKLRETLPEVFEASRPEIVFLVAGCDTLEGDPLARLRMTEAGIVKRDAMVIDACVRRDIPVVMTLGGGYSADAWSAQYASVARTIRTYGLAPGVTPDEPQ